MKETRQEIVEALMKIAPYARIAHHISGRIRLKFSPAAEKVLAGINIESIMTGIPGIHGHRINKSAGSVVIEYDPAILAPRLWEELALLKKNQAVQDKLQRDILDLWERLTRKQK